MALGAAHKAAKRVIQFFSVVYAGALRRQQLLHLHECCVINERFLAGVWDMDAFGPNHLTDVKWIAQYLSQMVYLERAGHFRVQIVPFVVVIQHFIQGAWTADRWDCKALLASVSLQVRQAPIAGRIKFKQLLDDRRPVRGEGFVIGIFPD